MLASINVKRDTGGVQGWLWVCRPEQKYLHTSSRHCTYDICVYEKIFVGSVRVKFGRREEKVKMGKQN